jgi:N-carbamoylputrescine amidase
VVIVQIIDVDGTILGNYRKSHIPDGNGYQEKFYFSPGDTGFKVFDTFYGRIGVAICWDQVIFIQYITYVLHVHFNLQCQWFPEAARAMALQGAEILCKCFIDKHIDILLYNRSLFIVHALIVYPTAIGSEPLDPSLDSSGHWERAMVGHSASNLVPVVASNRIGTETFGPSSITFYGE